jgi:hypothetical protein
MMALATAWIGLGQAAEPGTSGTLITQPEFLGGQVKLNWNSGGLLEAAPSPAGPWAAIDAPTLRQSAATIPVVPGHKFFRVVDNGVPTAAMPLVNSDPSRPFKIAKGFLRKAATDNGNAVIEAELEAGQNPPSVFPLLQDERVLVFRDDGQAGDAAAGDGTFTAPLFIDENDFIAANEFIKSMPPAFQVVGNFSGREAKSGILPTLFDIEAFLKGERVQVHPSPFDGRGLIPDLGGSGPNRKINRASARRATSPVVKEVCFTNIISRPEIILTNRLVSLPGGTSTNIFCELVQKGFRERFLTNVFCEPKVVGFRDGFMTNVTCEPKIVGFRDQFVTNVFCEPRIIGFNDPRRVTNVECFEVIVDPGITTGITNVCFTNVVMNPLRFISNVVCPSIIFDPASTNLVFTGTNIDGTIITTPGPFIGACVTNVTSIPEAVEFVTNVFCEQFLINVPKEPVKRLVCRTNIFTEPNPVPVTELVCVTNVMANPTPTPILELVCSTNLVPTSFPITELVCATNVTVDPTPEPIFVEECRTNIVTLPPQEFFTNVFLTNLVFTTNLTCTNVIVGGGDTNVIELPIDDFLNRPPFWGKSLLVTDLSVVEDPARTFDPCHPERSTKLGPWTFGRLMIDMCNQSATGIDPSEFTRRWLRSWQHDLSINFDGVADRNPEIVAQVIADWEQASGGPGAPLDLGIAPFRLLAIVNRLDLRGNPGYGGVNDSDPCNPSCIGGEGRFVFALVPGLRRTGGGGGGYGGGGDGVTQSSCEASQFTVIFEYCIPKRTCAEIKQFALEWYSLSQKPFGTAFNAALQAITDQFARAGADPSRKPNLSALNQLRANELLREPWDLREWRLFNNDSDAGWLREVTVKQTPDFELNFGQKIVDYCLANAGDILAEKHVVPLQFKREPFLGGNSPMPTDKFFWDGPQPTGTIPGEVRHKFSLNTCNGCHAGETGTPFTHVFPRSAGQEAALSDFLTGRNMPKLDPADHTTPRFFTDLKRREDDLLRLIKEPCFFQLFHEPVRFEH